MKKLVRKAFLYLLLFLAVVTISLVASTFLFKEEIIKYFISAANENLRTPVKIGSIDVSVFDHFPQFSIVFTDVYVEDSHKGQYPLLTAKRVSFQLNPLEVYMGKYTIQGLEIGDSETNLKINRDGESNYTVVKENSHSKNSTLGFDLKNVNIKNALVHFVDMPGNEEFHFSTEQLVSSIKNSNDIYTILATGEITSKKIRVENNTFFEEKSFRVKTHLVYDNPQQSLSIAPSNVAIKTSEFSIKGSYAWRTTPTIDLVIEGKKTNLQTLLSLLPEKDFKKFEHYESKGDAYFSAKIEGPITATKNPSLSVEFGLRNATITHPDTKVQLEGAGVEGSFATSDIADPHKAVLVLKKIEGSLNKEIFEANLVVQNFIDPDVIFNFKGLVDVQSLNGFYPLQDVSELRGKLQTNVSFQGKLSWLKAKATAQNASTTGTIELQNLNFLYGENKLPVKDLNGSLQFNNNDLALSNVTVQVGNSDFLVNGFFKNIITFLVFENQPIGIEADLKSKYLDVDQLFAIGYGSDTNQSNDYTFNISPNVNLNFNCEVNALRYKRFTAHKLKGDLLVKNQVAVSRNISVKTMGGVLELSGIVDAKNRKAIDVMTTAKLSGIQLDSAFYVFKNFDQDFIEDKHLKGQANADVVFELTLNEKLKLFPETLIADISAVVKNGELNNFEPLQKLNKYLDDEGLHQLRFGELKNDIHVENRTIYIPQMEVRSNVTTIQISGTHTFDQHIDYRMITPLKSKRKINLTEATGAMEEQAGQLKLFLKITGTTDDYRIQYDTEAVRKKIASDLKKEVQELKDAFKNKGKTKKKEIELSAEVFDWDN